MAKKGGKGEFKIKKNGSHKLWPILGFLGAVFLVVFGLVGIGNYWANAANLENFDAGNIISDYRMASYNTMSVWDIQNFLYEKNSCSNSDYEYYLTLSANQDYTWHFENGHFICLSEERFGDNDNEIGFEYGQSAAYIIWQAAQDYRINPQVLLVLLQKETGLITDPIPNNGDYRKATGYGCPDTSACSSRYYGFKNQVRNAAALFRTVLDGGWTNFPLGDNYIQYNPDVSCGGSTVNVQNLATSALYRYTPYQPNEAALLAGYGQGDECSTHGNRNFYNYMEDWFAEEPTITLVSVEQNGEPITPVFDEYLLNEEADVFGMSYYPTVNSADPVRVGVLVTGLEEGKSYGIYDTRRVESVTSENNGQVIYMDVVPTAVMGDSVECESGDGWQSCGYLEYANEYKVNLALEQNDSDWVEYNKIQLITRPATVGSSNVEITSVEQNGEELQLDTEGRRVKNREVVQTINEYQVNDYKSPVTINYNLKNLNVGWSYVVSVEDGSNSYSFTATTSEVQKTATLNLNLLKNHAYVNISVHGYGTGATGGQSQESEVFLYFRITDENFVKLDHLVIEEISQGGEPLNFTEGNYAGEYVFDANDVEDLEIRLSAIQATDDVNYYINGNLFSYNYSNYNSKGGAFVMASGAELKEGITILVPARYGESESGSFYLNIMAKTNEQTYGNPVKYHNNQYNPQDGGEDRIVVNFYVDETIPRLSVDYDYGVYQGENELTPNGDDVYMISDYTEEIKLRTTVAENEGVYCLEKKVIPLDDYGEELQNTSGWYGSYCSQFDGEMQNETNVELDIRAKTTRLELTIYDMTSSGEGSYTKNRKLAEFSLDFAYQDYESEHTSRIEVTEFRQGGRVLEPSDVGNGRMRFTVNPYEDYEYDVQGFDLLEGELYTLWVRNERMEISKSDLENGVTVRIPMEYGFNWPSRGTYSVVFGEYNRPTYAGSQIEVTMGSPIGDDTPYYDFCVKYQNSENCMQGTYPSIGLLPPSDYVEGDIENYDSINNPLVLRFAGARYDGATSYPVKVKIKYAGEVIVDDEFQASGTELNNGFNKNYFNELHYMTLNQLFSGTFVEGSYDVDVKVGNGSRNLSFVLNGGAWLPATIFSSEGLAFTNYYNERGEMLGGGGGDWFVGYYDYDISHNLFGDHAYMYLGALSEFDGEANYHIYRHPVGEDVNDLSDAVMLSEGVVNANADIGLVRIDKGEGNADDLDYVVVVEKGGRILSMGHYRVHLKNSVASEFGFGVALRTDDVSALKDGGTGASYSLLSEVPVKAIAYGTRLDEAVSYELGVAVRVNGGIIYEDSVGVSVADLNGETRLMTIPYANVFGNGATYYYLEFTLKDANSGDVLSRRTVYLTRSSGEDGGLSGIEDAYGAIRELERGEEPEEPENPEEPVPIDNLTDTGTNVRMENGVLMVTSKKACMVVGEKDGAYTAVEPGLGSLGEDGSETRGYNILSYDRVKVVLKGDGNMDKRVSSADSNLVNRSLIGRSLPLYRPLSDLEKVLLDLNGDNRVSSADSNIINRSLIGHSLQLYQPIEW